jgi:hypothetical protein
MIGYRFGDLLLLNVFDQHIKIISPYSLGRGNSRCFHMFWFEDIGKKFKIKLPLQFARVAFDFHGRQLDEVR